MEFSCLATAPRAGLKTLLVTGGISVVYRAKPAVQQQATYALNYTGLDGMLNCFIDGGAHADAGRR